MNIFISYSHKDKEFVLRLFQSLRTANLEVFLDEKDIQIGDDIPASIERALEDASVLVYVISRYSVTSKWVREELSMAKMKAVSKNLKIIPILIDEIQIPMAVSHLKYADFLNWQQMEIYFKRIGALLSALGVNNTLPHESVMSFAISNLELLQDASRAFRSLFHRVEALIEGYHVGGTGDVYYLSKQAFDNAHDLGISAFANLLKQKLSDQKDPAFSDLKESLHNVDKCLAKLASREVWDEIGWLWDSKKFYKSLASHLEKLERSASLQALSLLRDQ